MTLNRKLNGRDLPPNTQIVGAMNPSDENGYYQVSELDPAFLDRWNRYSFKPTVEEWVYWAIKNKLHKHVIGFITKNTVYLDPETNPNENAKVSAIQPSRRTWKRVSDNLKKMEEKKAFDLDTVQNILMGMVGVGATAKFIDYVKKEGSGITASSILLKFDKETIKVLENMKNQELLAMNIEIFSWFNDNVEEMKASKTNASKYIANLKRYLHCINPEIMSHFLSSLAELNDDGLEWPSLVLSIDNTLANKYFEMLQGRDIVEKENDN
jgi:hypothetical protein